MILSEAVTRWIAARSINLAVSTVSGYNRLNRKYIAGLVVDKPVDSLSDLDMIDLLRPLIERGITRQAQLLQTLVSATLKDCVRRREISHNPMECVDRVKHAARITPWLTIEQARQLLKTSADDQDPYYVAWVLMVCCGLRRGEMLGLQWEDIDFDRGILSIRRQMVRVDRKVLVTRTKSVTSARDIPLDEHLLSILRLNCPGKGRIIDASEMQLSDGLERALKRAGLPHVSLHGLRHTMAAIAAGKGVPIKILQSLMGHAHFSTTADIYAHVNERPRQEAAATIVHSVLDARLEIA